MKTELRPLIGVGSVCSPLEVGAERAADAASRLAGWIENDGGAEVE